MVKKSKIGVFCENHLFIGFWICLLLGMLIVFWNNMSLGWGDIYFHYPEEKYRLLEGEASKIISKHAFDTEYEYEILNYSSKTDEIKFKLYASDLVNVELDVQNFSKENATVNTLKRNVSFPLLCFVFDVILLGLLLGLSIYLVLVFIWLFIP